MVGIIIMHLCFSCRNSSGGNSGGSGNGSGEGNSPESRVLATLLTEMDGISGNNNNLFVFAATNRMDAIDAALLRKVSLE